MTAYSTKGTTVCLLKGAATSAAAVPSAITKASPAVVTFTTLPAGIAAGDVLAIPAGGTGFSELDGKSWVVGTVDSTAKTVTLIGSNTTGSTGTLAALPTMNHYDNADFTCLCLSSIAFNPESANTISVATFCDPTATIPSQVVGAGTIEIGGFVDITDAGYKELVAAELDGKSRTWRVKLGNAQGYILFDGILSSMSLELPIDGATTFAGTVNLSSKYRHLF